MVALVGRLISLTTEHTDLMLYSDVLNELSIK